jgi:hypothetical protein
MPERYFCRKMFYNLAPVVSIAQSSTCMNLNKSANDLATRYHSERDRYTVVKAEGGKADRC